MVRVHRRRVVRIHCENHPSAPASDQLQKHERAPYSSSVCVLSGVIIVRPDTELRLLTTSCSAWSSTVLSTGSTSHGLTSGCARRPASMPMRPRDVIPVDLRCGQQGRIVEMEQWTHKYTVMVKIWLVGYNIHSELAERRRAQQNTHLALKGRELFVDAAPGRTVPCAWIATSAD